MVLALKSSPLEYLVTNALTYFVGKCITNVKGCVWLMCISGQFTNVKSMVVSAVDKHVNLLCKCLDYQRKKL